ncbi:MAG: hypothetical protein PVS3B1_10100 [Ktedonobacteraceae bacterium]
MDLWAKAEHNDDELPPVAGASENGPTHILRRARRLTDSATLSLFRTWLLQDYVAAYCRSLAATRIFKRCYWVDALGIEGRQVVRNDPAERIAATPEPAPRSRKKGPQSVIAPALQPVASLAQVLAQDSKPISLHGLILQGGSSKSGRRANTREKTPERVPPQREIAVPIEGGIVRASWLEAASQLLKETEQSPAIFLLNPLGPTLFNYDDLAPLYQRTVPTELCLLIPHKQIEARLPAAHKYQAQATALTALLRSNRWKALPVEDEKQGEAVAGFIELFLASMQRHFQLPPQRITLPAPVGPASIAPLPYTLIYATRRQDSLLSMNDALCLYRRRTYQESYQGVLGEEWFAQQDQEHRTTEEAELARRIRQQGAAARIRRWPDLRQQLILANFGQFTHDEYDTIIQQLISSKEVHCIWRLPPGDTRESVPGNDDTLQWK